MNFHSVARCIATVVALLGVSQANPDERDNPTTAAADSMVGKKPGQVRDDNGLNMKLVWCPPGEFTMGSPEAEANRSPNEGPVEVTLTKGFWIGQTEITQGQWEKIMARKPWKGQKHVKEGADYPATFVTADDAFEFCRKLTEQEQTAKRLAQAWEFTLPTEAQWEYACRAGTKTRFSFGEGDEQIAAFAWCVGSESVPGSVKNERYAHQVGLKKPNPWGLHDTHGNVWELCRDWDDDTLTGGTDPLGPVNGTRRICRGGGWNLSPGFCRSAIRVGADVPLRADVIGFRIACARQTSKITGADQP